LNGGLSRPGWNETDRQGGKHRAFFFESCQRGIDADHHSAVVCPPRLGWAEGRLRFEIFATATPVAGDQSFEVVLNNSGKTFRIPPDKTILGVLIEAGEDPMHDCQRGDCGICQVGVIEGTPDHRDYILTDAEKAAGKVMQICVSRSKSPRLVLDL